MLARIIDTFYGMVLGFCGGILGAIVLVILDRAGLIESGWQDRLKETSLISSHRNSLRFSSIDFMMELTTNTHE